mmetsp:Transcript_5679/g.11818  ORF Transcript_5679/g.11818 Transcript_5679/m.11818 type:complete len:106 (-) Transcript_5679:2153-2470(-)
MNGPSRNTDQSSIDCGRKLFPSDDEGVQTLVITTESPTESPTYDTGSSDGNSAPAAGGNLSLPTPKSTRKKVFGKLLRRKLRNQKNPRHSHISCRHLLTMTLLDS